MRLVDLVVGELASSLVAQGSLQTAQGEAARAGHPLGQLLVQRRLLTTDQLLELLRAAERTPLGCQRCGAQHAYTSLDPQADAICPICDGPLGVAQTSSRRSMHRTLALNDTRPDSDSNNGGTGRFPHGTGPFPGMGPSPMQPGPSGQSHLIQRPRSGRIPASSASTSRRFAGTASARQLGADGMVEEFGPYQLVEELGRGGMGVVYKARQPGLDRFVALKVLLGGELASETQVKRFQREAEIAARLKHPAIVQIHDVGLIGDHHYLTMDFVDGTPLSKLIKRRKLSIGRAATIVRDIARGLEHAHKKGVIHRDIKPANIIVEKEGSPVITDFGLARDEDPTAMTQLTRDGAMVGTPFYMSPEQASGKRENLSGKSDVFALGVVLFELICHELPFHAETHIELSSRILNDEPPRPRELRPDLDPDLETIVLKALEKSPHRRYAAGELADDLDRYLQGQPILARPQSVFSRWGRKVLKNKRLALVVFSLLLAVGATAFLVVDRLLRLANAPTGPGTAVLPTPTPTATATPGTDDAGAAEAAAAVRKATEALDRARRTPAGAEYRFALEEAVRRLTDALALPQNAKDAELLVKRGVAYLRLRRAREGSRDLEQVLALEPPGPPRATFEAAFQLAQHRLREGDEQACLAVVERALTRASPPAADTEANAWRNLLSSYRALKKGKLEECLALVGRARELSPLLAATHMEEGRLQLIGGRAEEARRALLKAVEIDPKDAYAWTYLARIHLSLDPRRGESDLDRALEIDPELDLALQQRAVLRHAKGQTTEAISDMRQVLEARPKDPDVLYQLATLYDGNDQPRQAQAMLTRLEEAAPADPRPYRYRCRQYLLAGEFSIALEQLSRGVLALAKRAKGSRAHRRLVKHWEETALSVNAVEAIDRYAAKRLKLNPNDGHALALQAKVRFQLDQKSKDAKRLLDEARKRDPRSTKALELHLLMIARETKSYLPEVNRELEAFAARIDPQDARRLAALSRFYAIVAEDFTKADAYARRARRLAPDLAEPLLMLGHVALKRERLKEALQFLLMALDRDPYSDETLQMLGALFFNRRKLAQAERYLRGAYELDPLGDNAIDGLGLLLLRTKRMRACYALTRRYVQLCLKARRRPNPSAISNLTRCQIQLGEEDAAFKLLDVITRQHPDVVTYELLRAELYLRLRRFDMARRVTLAAQKKAPDRPDIKALLRQIELERQR